MRTGSAAVLPPGSPRPVGPPGNIESRATEEGSAGRRRRRSFGSLAAMAFLAAGTAMVGLLPFAGPAQAAGGSGLGFVWASQDSANGCYTPVDAYSQTPASSQDNEICRTGTGTYRVRLAGLGQLGGVAQATAYGTGSNARTCAVTGWQPSGNDQYVNVLCSAAPSGARADTKFTLSYTNLRSAPSNSPSVSGTSFGYLWSERARASSTCWTPTATYQYHTRGGNARVCRSGVGIYRVDLPAQENPMGTVQVGAYGSGARCKVLSWGTSQAQVRCFGHAGAPTDSRFSLSYARKGNVLGGRLRQGLIGTGYDSAYAWASNATAASYSLPAGSAYQFNTHSSYAATAYRSSVGHYRTSYASALALGEGTVQVTGYGSGNGFCNVGSWNANGINVNCYDAAGRAADNRYTVAFTGKYHTPPIAQ